MPSRLRCQTDLVKANVFHQLAAARQAPRSLPTDRGYEALAEQVRSLDAVLGADLDTPPSTSTNPSPIEQGAGNEESHRRRGALQKAVVPCARQNAAN